MLVIRSDDGLTAISSRVFLFSAVELVVNVMTGAMWSFLVANAKIRVQ
jgi:hypothetical protein